MPNKNSMNNTLSTLDTFSIVLWVCSIQCEESSLPACRRHRLWPPETGEAGNWRIEPACKAKNRIGCYSNLISIDMDASFKNENSWAIIRQGNKQICPQVRWTGSNIGHFQTKPGWKSIKIRKIEPLRCCVKTPLLWTGKYCWRWSLLRFCWRGRNTIMFGY